jgi:hypothetical protein
MPDEPLALSTIPPTVAADGDYDAICVALRQSERGRWFLEEHTRRSRNGAAGAVIRGERTQATQTDVLATVERLQDLAWTMREHGLDPAACEPIEILVSTILAASWLRDPNDRRARKLGEALGLLERRIDSMIAAAKDARREPAESASTAAPSELPPSGQGEPAPIPSGSADDDPTVPVESAAGTNTRETVADATTVRVPTMWEPPSEPPAASPMQPPPDDWTADIEDELFAAPALPVPQAAGATAAGSAPNISTRSDPLAALNALSDAEKIALFT